MQGYVTITADDCEVDGLYRKYLPDFHSKNPVVYCIREFFS